MTLELCFIADVLLLLLSLWCVVQVSEASIFNPALWWITLHAYTVTFRLLTLNLGVAPTAVLGIRSDSELVNAAIASDITLLAIVLATVFAYRPRMETGQAVSSMHIPIPLNDRLGQIISILCITIGTYFLVKFGYHAAFEKARGVEISAIDIGGFEKSAYPITIAGFAAQGALIQVAMRGFTRVRLILFLGLLAISSVNLARQGFLLPAIMAFLIYQTRRNGTNVPLRWMAGLLALAALWFVFKPVVAAFNEGESFSQIVATAQEYAGDVLSHRRSGDTNFFDMQATYMAAADEQGRRFYGSTVLPLIYLPIPRFMWPEKPTLSGFAKGIETPGRPVATAGMTMQLSGESYLNFGYWGCAIIPFLYMLAMLTFYRRVRCYGMASAARMVYLVFLVCMIQTFRDGLASLVLFPIVVFFPFAGWSLISAGLEFLGLGLRTDSPPMRLAPD